jgi:hypothetical protein
MIALRSIAIAVGCLLSLSAQAQTPDPDAKWTLPVAGKLDGSTATIENKPCCTASSGTPVDQSDAAALAAAPGLASRNGPVLTLKLADNRVLSLTDCLERSGCPVDDVHVHRLVAWWPNRQIFVLSVGMYEGSTGFLVSARTGRTLTTTAPAVLSPSGQFAVALTSNLMAGMELELIDLRPDPPTLAKITSVPECKGFGPDTFLRPTPVWIDGSHVRFEGVSPQPDDKPDTKQLLRIVDGKAVWEC